VGTLEKWADRRYRVTHFYSEGIPISDIAKLTGYSRSHVSYIVREYLALEWITIRRALDDCEELDMIFEQIGKNERLSIAPRYTSAG